MATVWSPIRADTVAFSGITPRFCTTIVNVTLPPTTADAGSTATEAIARSGLAFTIMVMVTLCETSPLVATASRLYVPRLIALTVSVTVPGLVIVFEAGITVNPEDDIVVIMTEDGKPLIPPMVTLTFAVTDGSSGPMLVGLAVIVKSTTFNVTFALCVSDPLVPVTVMM